MTGLLLIRNILVNLILHMILAALTQERPGIKQRNCRNRRCVCVKSTSKPTSPPICKTGTWSCTGEQSALAVLHGPLTVLVGLRVPTPAVGGTVSTPASSLPGLQEIASHRHIVPAWCTGVLACQVRVTLVVAKRLCF